MKNTLRNLLLTSTLALLVACGAAINQDSFAKIKNDMTSSEVKAILGEPTEMKSGELMGMSSSTYIYKSDTAEISIVFFNDKVKTHTASFK